MPEPAHVLVVDDTASVTELFRMMLEMEGYSVAIAGDVQEALAALDERIPDLILLDIMLPEASGLDLCRMIRENPQRSGIPIVIVSAKSELEEVQAGLEAGADRYLLKPVSKSELTDAVHEALSAS